jgi:hypothetical protein
MFDKDGKIKKELVEAAIKHLRDSNKLIPSVLMKTPAPEGSLCPTCQQETLIIHKMPFTGPYLGGIICSSCDWRDSVIGYLGKQMFQVQPMPQGAEQIYLKDPEDKEE